MAHKKVKCSVCNTVVKMEHVYFYKNLMNYSATTSQQLDTVYMCRECRYLDSRTNRIPVVKLPKYMNVLKDLRTLTKEFYTRGGPNNPSILHNFIENVEILFKREHVNVASNEKDYRVLIVNNTITGFKIINVPIIGDIYFPIKEVNKRSK